MVATAVIALQRAGAQACHRSSSTEASRLLGAQLSNVPVRMRCDVVGVGVSTVIPPAGSRIRIFITHELDSAGHPMGVVSELVGILRRSNHDTLVVDRSGLDTVLTVAYIVRMEVVEGTTTAALPVAIGGAIGGGLFGLLAGNVAACGLTALQGCSNVASHERQGFVTGGLAGAAIGAMIGSLFRGDRWVDVPIRVARATVAPGQTGFAATFHATF
jgi:hypothetical protein